MTEIQKKKTLGLAIASLVFGCLFIFPLLGIVFSLTAVILGIVALTKISKNKETLKGEGLAISGIVLGGIGIVIIPIIAILAAIAIPNLLKARLNANDALAGANVKTISVALESYANANNGQYPSDEYALTNANPPYLPNAFGNKTIGGHTYSLNLSTDGYEVSATPEQCATTGIKIFTARTKEEFSSRDCK